MSAMDCSPAAHCLRAAGTARAAKMVAGRGGMKTGRWANDTEADAAGQAMLKGGHQPGWRRSPAGTPAHLLTV